MFDTKIILDEIKKNTNYQTVKPIELPECNHENLGDEVRCYNQFYIEEKKTSSKNEIAFMDFSNFERALRTAEMLCKAKCIPQKYWDNPSDALVVIQCGHEIGLSPMKSLQTMMIINNVPSIYGDTMLAICMKTKGKVGGFIDCVEVYDEDSGEWTCTVTRDGRVPKTYSFTNKEAEIGGFTKKPGPWQTNRKRMMQLKPRNFVLRDMFADILTGVMTVEEMEDIPKENNNKINEIEIKNTAESMKERLRTKLGNPNIVVSLDNESKDIL